jgi:hypothetical protein
MKESLTLPRLLALLMLLVVTGTGQAETPGQARNDHLNDLARALANAQRGDEVVTLGEGDDTFLGLSLQQRTATPQGAVLILHDEGQNPDWPANVQQARNFLPDIGWNTLSIALPLIGGYQTNARTTLDRIALGVQRLNQEGQFNLVILGYGEGAYWAARYLSERLAPDQDVGYALMMVNAKPIEPDLRELIGGLEIAILDWVSDDSTAALKEADARRAEARRNQRERYTQIRDPQQASFYNQASPNRSTRRLWGWLRTRAAGREGEVRTVEE